MATRAIDDNSRYVDREVVQRILKAADAGATFCISLLIAVATARSLVTPGAPATAGLLAVEIALVCVFVLRALDLYDVNAMVRGTWSALRATAACVVTGAAIFAIANSTVLPLRSGWIVWWIALLLAHFALTRGAVAIWARPIAASGRFRKRIAIVGGGKAAEEALNAIESSRGIDAEVIGLFDDRYDSRSPESIRSHRKIGKIAELADFARQHRVDLIIVAIPLSAEARLLHILKRLWELPVDIRISGQASALKFGPRAYTYLGKLPLLTVFDRPLKGWSLFVKDVVDRLIALAAIVALSPVMLVTALAVRLESEGPVIFRQRRYGFNNELIEVFKFRSMYVKSSDATASKLVTKNDPRVTRVGRIIRKSSIDELPQLFNVLLGNLSLVGPRPHATQAKAADALYEQVVDGYFARHKVKPGITGWAQIHGWRGETDTREKIEQRVKHDLEYIDRWSLGLDLYILVRTPFALLKSENAY